MSFFQNVFDFEFRPTLFGADRQYQMSFKLPANTNRSDYMLSGNAEPYDLSPSNDLMINYAIDTNFVNFSTITVNISGSNISTMSAFEIASALNSDSRFSELFAAYVYSSTNNAVLPKKVAIKGKNNKGIFRAYILNLGAEKILQFNKNAPIRELPSLFSKYTIANRFAYPNLGVDRILELDPEDPYEGCLIKDAGFNPNNPQPDWQLMQGVNDGFWFYSRTYDDGKIAAEIKYPSGAKAGNLSKKTYYNYSGSDLVGVMETPHVLQQSDIMNPPDALNFLWNWGDNGYGQLGNNNTNDVSSPVQTIAGGANWSHLSCSYHTAAIKADGTLWVWGNNDNGELGTNDTTHYSSPVQTISGGNTWTQVSCGHEHTGAIKTDGTLWMMGNNYNSQLGTSDTTYRSSPIQTFIGGNNWTQVSCGYAHTAAIKTDGTLWAWGMNYTGQLGDNTNDKKSVPVQVLGAEEWFQVSCGNNHTSAVKCNGTLWVWGDNNDGQLGTNDTISYSSPVQTVFGGNNWRKTACGGNHTLAIKSDGTLWAWGDNYSGQLGNDTVVSKSSPIQIGMQKNWSKISAGESHSAAIKKDGTLWCCGEGGSGQIGDDNTIWYSSPVQTITQGSTWNQVSCGRYNTAGLKF